MIGLSRNTPPWSDRVARWACCAAFGHLGLVLIVITIILGMSCVSSAGQESNNLRTMKIHVGEACDSRFVADATIEAFDPVTAKRQVLGRTDKRGTATVTFGTNVTTLLVCKKYYYCVAIFPSSLRGVEETDVALPRWSIR